MTIQKNHLAPVKPKSGFLGKSKACVHCKNLVVWELIHKVASMPLGHGVNGIGNE
jgi:hypothetical protein